MVAQTGACGRKHDPRVRTLRNFATVKNVALGAEGRRRRTQVGGDRHTIWSSGRCPNQGVCDAPWRRILTVRLAARWGSNTWEGAPPFQVSRLDNLTARVYVTSRGWGVGVHAAEATTEVAAA